MAKESFKPTIREEHMEVLKDKSNFVTDTGKAIGTRCGGIQDVHYIVYQNEETGTLYEFIMIIYHGGAYAVRSVNGDSHSAILREIAKMADGGYYSENDAYRKLVKDPKIHKIIG